MSSYNVGLIYPSRGVTYTETLKEVLEELQGVPHKIYWSHGNKLPACFNKPLSRALRAKHTHIWFIEDDMVIKKGILKELLEADEDIISCDYPLVGTPSGTVLYDPDDNAIFTGTGCMLAKRKVFDGMPRPIFRADITWSFKQVGGKVKFTATSNNPDFVYGNHDITFGLYQYYKRKPIVVSKTVLAQRKLVKKGVDNNNNGVDKIILFDKYKKINWNMIVEEPPINSPKDGLLTIVEVDGKEVHVTKETAVRLKAAGVLEPKVRTKGHIILDMNKNEKALRYFDE
jgi:hypothetical protein